MNYLKNKVRFALVGFGFVGRRHAQIIAQHPEAELVAICDNRALESEINALYPQLPFFQHLDGLLEADLDLDVISLCTPNGLHAKHAIKCLRRQHHVLCEKPLALTKNECEQIIFESLNASRHVFGVMQNRYSPPAQWLKAALAENILGEVFMVQVNCFWNRDDRYYFPEGRKHPWKGTRELDGGTLFTQFSHFVDMLYWLFGDIENIEARFANFNHQHCLDFEDSGMISFDFCQGGMGSFHYSTAVQDCNFESSMTIIASKGTVRIGGQYMEKVVYCHVPNYTLPELPPANPPNDYGAYQGSASNHQFVIQNVIDVLKGRKSISTNALEGLKVVEIIEKIYRLRQRD